MYAINGQTRILFENYARAAVELGVIQA